MREGQTFSGRSRFTAYVNLVRLPHTLFALPFALVGATLASYHAPVTLREIGWIVLAFTAARFAAMGFNRIVDRRIDAGNPRTAMRELPRGVLSVPEASLAVAIASVLFVVSAWQLNGVCFALSPLALAWVFFYSFTKRFTRWSHLVLGVGLAMAPAGGYLAITGRWSEPWWMLWTMALAVTTWSGGFDILYSLQDVEFDRANRLHSVPATLGEARAITIARVLHTLTVSSLVLVGLATSAGWLYWVGTAVAAGLLLYEHTLVAVDDLSRLNAAFFTMNGVISIVFFAFVLAERLVR
jgi:4-hydroxybenzoate polyprenyltransferase